MNDQRKDQLGDFVRESVGTMFEGRAPGRSQEVVADANGIEIGSQGHAMMPTIAAPAPVEPDQPTDESADPLLAAPVTEPDRADADEARFAVESWLETLTSDEKEAIALDPDSSDQPFLRWLRERVPPAEAARTFAAARWVAEQPTLVEAVGIEPPEPALVRGVLTSPEEHGFASLEEAEEALIFAATATDGEWLEQCRLHGVDPDTVRPGRNSLPPYLTMRIIRANLDARAERLPPAYVRPGPYLGE